MNKEDYVSLECAKLLKEKGYKELCTGCYRNNKFMNINSFNDADMFGGDFYAAPTLYEAAKWLRGTHDIHIVVSPHYSRKYEIIEYEYRIATYFDFLEEPFKWRKSKEYYEKYEQCLNDAILEALKLI